MTTRTALLEALDRLDDGSVPCRAVGIYASAAWIADADAEQRTAAAACRSQPCPVIDLCRAYGLANLEAVGAYGGMTERERKTP